MLIYLKGINSGQLKYLLDFMYNGEVSVRKEELKGFLETGNELQVKGFEGDVSGLGENVKKETVIRFSDENEAISKKKDNFVTENLICDALETYTETHFTNGSNKGKNEIKELDLQITQMVEKSDGVWKCKVCEKIT